MIWVSPAGARRLRPLGSGLDAATLPGGGGCLSTFSPAATTSSPSLAALRTCSSRVALVGSGRRRGYPARM